MQSQPALPHINLNKVGARFEVNWDYQEAPETDVLRTKGKWIDGFIAGVLIALDISEKNVSCATPLTGTVRKLDEDTAQKLASILEGLLHPLVKAEHKRLVNHANLPHIRFAAEREKAE
jgi:hypothetical protein